VSGVECLREGAGEQRGASSNRGRPKGEGGLDGGNAQICVRPAADQPAGGAHIKCSPWKGGAMRILLARILCLLGGLAAGLVAGLLLPAEQYLKLSQQLASGIGSVAEQMPGG